MTARKLALGPEGRVRDETRFSPPVAVERIPLLGKDVFVVRDDHLEGGTKQRALLPFLQDLSRRGYETFVYASPFSGFAQVALASGCRTLGLRCVLFCESDPNAGELRPRAHEFTLIAQAYGAEIVLAPTLAEAEAAASAFAAGKDATHKIPLGFRSDAYMTFLEQSLKRQFRVLCYKIRMRPRRLWIPVGSGTLAQVFARIIPPDVSLQCVDVHVLKACDERIVRVKQLTCCQYLSAEEDFPTPAQVPPPLASNKYYDSKIWRFLLAHAASGDVWWNVAR